MLDCFFNKLGVYTIALVTFLVSVIPGINTMDPIVLGQAGATIAYAPWYAVTIPFRPQTSCEVECAKARAGGFMRGICHSGDDFTRLPEANIQWERLDVPFPFEEDGATLREEYKTFKENLIDRKALGLQSMIVTPKPMEFLEHGIDPRTPAGGKKAVEVTTFIVSNLKPYIGAVQIANELGLPRFSYPLNLEECVSFLVTQLEALAPIKGNILVGYNTGGPQMDLNALMKPYLHLVDYIGLDIYVGCFFGVATWVVFGRAKPKL